ncbi:NepR family anti-sigma factor [Roseovarius sp. CAU 1744]|uniref:NepR family anti-sigma factor n=1 Tax=Roseovarius sp. CAU 1744 TaxID=3140368 RepID=UPI00325AA658
MSKKRRNPKVDQQIDENLRRVYAEAAEEPVPDRFTQLLEQLRQQEQSKQGDEDGTNK